MANFKEVNKAIKANVEGLDIVAVRGDGYVYFTGNDSDNIESVCAHPVSTSTEDMIDLCLSNIDEEIRDRKIRADREAADEAEANAEDRVQSLTDDDFEVEAVPTAEEERAAEEEHAAIQDKIAQFDSKRVLVLGGGRASGKRFIGSALGALAVASGLAGGTVARKAPVKAQPKPRFTRPLKAQVKAKPKAQTYRANVLAALTGIVCKGPAGSVTKTTRAKAKHAKKLAKYLQRTA